MDIRDFSDKELINFIFNGDIRELRHPDDIQFLFMKCKNFIRHYMAYNENIISELQQLKKEHSEIKQELKDKTHEFKILTNTKEEECVKRLNRELTLKERISGKLNRS